MYSASALYKGKSMERIVMTSYARTPLDSQKGKEFQEMSIPDLALASFKAALERSKLGNRDVDGVVAGNVNQGTGEALNLGRHLALKAGLDIDTAQAYTVNRICGSGFQAVASCMMQIWAGEGDVFVAAGCEMNSHKMISLPLDYAWKGMPKGGIVLGGGPKGDASFPLDRFGTEYVAEDGTVIPYMGPALTVEKAAKLYNVSREEADIFANDSQAKMKRAQAENRFENEIVPIEYPVTDRKGKVTMVKCDTDLHPKPDTNMEGLAKLPPAFVPGGVVTAGNASGSVDGSASIVLMSETEQKRRGLPNLGYVNAFAFAGCDPTIMGTGPVPAIQRLFAKTGMGFDDIDAIEINEAFAAQVVSCIKLFGEEIGGKIYQKLNPNGGAVSIGHPEGCTGVRLTMTMAEELRRTGKRFGVSAACIGGGQGGAVLIENPDFA